MTELRIVPIFLSVAIPVLLPAAGFILAALLAA
jgi:hypothetical protein